MRIGLQTDVQVTFARRFEEPRTPTRVSQAFFSAVSCAYTRNVATDAWAPLATLVLDAAYEATLGAAVLDEAERAGSGKVRLTLLGGGAFGNRGAWIGEAIRRAIAAVAVFELDLRIGHDRQLDEALLRWVDGS